MKGGRAVGRTVGRVFCATVFCSSVRPPDRLTAQSRSWRPEDRVVISDFSTVDAVAASPWVVYAATRHGLVLYDLRSHRWQPPVTALDGYPGSRVRAALADPVGNAVWLGTDEGWAHYDGIRWDGGPATGGVTGLMLDARDPASGVFLRDQAGWRFLPRGGLLALPGTPLPPPERRIAPLEVQAALNAAPMAQALRALVLTDPRLKSYQFTSAARPEDGTDLFFGTNGLGLLRIDPAVAQWEPLPFTLQDAGADALTANGDGVWAVSAARFGDKSGLTWIPEDLSATKAVEPRVGAGFGAAPVYRVLASDNVLWVATGAGLFKVDAATGQTRRFTPGDGLPSEDVRALAPAAGGAWIGTTRGLALTAGADRITRLGDNGPAILSLLVVRETLWVGSAAGLGMVPPGAPEPMVPADVQAEPALRAPVVALARCGDTLVAVLPDQVAWRDPAASRWTVERPRVVLGTVTAAASDAGGVWLGGTAGLAWWNIGRATYQRLVIPGDLPAPVRDVAASARWVWVATDSGVVRLRRDVIVGGR